MHRHRAALSGPGTFFAGQCWADYIISMAGFDLRQGQPLIAVRRRQPMLPGMKQRAFGWPSR
jgi:hypothetical protein